MLELDLVLERFLGENYTQLTAQWRVRGETPTASVLEQMLRGCHDT